MKGERSEFIVRHESPLKWTEVDDVLIVTGVALSPGTYTGIDGTTITYPTDVVNKSSPTLLGVDYMTAHTPTGQVGGTVVGHSMDGEAAMYKAVVAKPDAVANVKAGFGTSVEADVKTTWDEEIDGWRATSVVHKKLCQTDKPACPTARVSNIKQVKLEKVGNNMTDDNEKKIIELKAKLDLAEEDKKTVKLATEKAAADAKKAFDDAKTASDQVELTLKTERDDWKAKYDTLSAQVRTAELERLTTGIKAIDKTFDGKKFLEGIESFDTQKIVLSKHLETLSGIKAGTVKLEVAGAGAGTTGDATARLEKATTSFYGAKSVEEAAKTIMGFKGDDK